MIEQVAVDRCVSSLMSIPVPDESLSLWHFADIGANNELMMLLAHLGQHNEDEVLARLPRISYEILDQGARERLVCAHFFLILRGQGADAAIEFLRRIIRLGQPRLRYGLKAHIRLFYPELEPFSTFAATEVDGNKHVRRRHTYWRRLQLNPMPELNRYVWGLMTNTRLADAEWMQSQLDQLRQMYPSIPQPASMPKQRVREVVVDPSDSRDSPSTVSSDTPAPSLITEDELMILRKHYESRSGFPARISQLCVLLLDQPCVTFTDQLGQVWAHLIRENYEQARGLAGTLRGAHPHSIDVERLQWYAKRPHPKRDRGLIVDRFQGTVRKVTRPVPEPTPERVRTDAAQTRLKMMIKDPQTRNDARMELLGMSAAERMGEWAAILLMEVLIDEGDFEGANQVFERHRSSFTSATFHRFNAVFRERLAIRAHGPRRKRNTFFDDQNAALMRPVNRAARNDLLGIEHRQPGEPKPTTYLRVITRKKRVS